MFPGGCVGTYQFVCRYLLHVLLLRLAMKWGPGRGPKALAVVFIAGFDMLGHIKSNEFTGGHGDEYANCWAA
jgi:hypothetical protein